MLGCFLVFQRIFYERIYFISKRKFINRLNQTFYHNSTCSSGTNTSVLVFFFEAVSGKTGAPSGWRWKAMLGYGDVIPFLGVTILSSAVTFVCFLALLFIFLQRGAKVPAFIAAMELFFILISASNIIHISHWNLSNWKAYLPFKFALKNSCRIKQVRNQSWRLSNKRSSLNQGFQQPVLIYSDQSISIIGQFLQTTFYKCFVRLWFIPGIHWKY